ncbi:30S ribosomal protein S16 [Candidatus Hodgkinia cicadicola]|nr:30S ribosomal protein S16 [Candidatus Hodgkinia cicadicola]
MVRINLFRKRINHWCFVVISSKRNKKIIDQVGYSRWIGNKFKVCLNIRLLKYWMSNGALFSSRMIRFLITSGIM